MLLFSGPKNTDLIRISQRFTEWINVMLITYNKLPDLLPINNCIDPTGIAHQIYGAKTSCVYIIRPDGYIGYRSKRINESDIEAFFNAIFKR